MTQYEREGTIRDNSKVPEASRRKNEHSAESESRTNTKSSSLEDFSLFVKGFDFIIEDVILILQFVLMIRDDLCLRFVLKWELET